MECERYELRGTQFRGGEEEDLELWSLRLSAILESKEIAGAIYECQEPPSETEESERLLYKRKVGKTRAIIITMVGDKPLRAVQPATHTAGMVHKLINRYAANTTARNIAVMTSFIHTHFDGTKEMGEYLSEMESLFNKLGDMGSELDRM